MRGGDLSPHLSFCELFVDFLPRTRCLFVSKSSKLAFCEIFASCQIDVSRSIADELKTNSRPRNTTHAVVSGTGIRLAKRERRERFRRVVPVRSARFCAGRRGGDAQQRGERRWPRPPCGAPFRGCCSRHSGGRATRGVSRA